MAKKLGFHYYTDSSHYDHASLDYWLPALHACGARWLVLEPKADFEIPENFLRRLTADKIEPLIRISYPLSNPPAEALFRQRLIFYRNCGVRLLQFFAFPNMRGAWDLCDWQKPNLVKRFVQIFCRYAQICIQERIIPIFPTLAPNGDYPDGAFLRHALQSICKSEYSTLIPNLVFSAQADLGTRSFEWIADETLVDLHCADKAHGFFSFRTYSALIREIFGKENPILLFDAGRWSTNGQGDEILNRETRSAYIKILTLVQSADSDICERLPDHVLSCCLSRLPQAELLKKDPTQNYLEKVAEIDPQSSELISSLRLLVGGLYTFLGKTGVNTIEILRMFFSALSAGKNPLEYLLLPDRDDLLTDAQREIINRYIRTAKCDSGKNLSNALCAKKVAIIGDAALYPSNVLRQLRMADCRIQTISNPKGYTRL